MQILDNGYVKLIETWGSDERFIESATYKLFIEEFKACNTQSKK